jgi:Cu2+-exporting ATPase
MRAYSAAIAIPATLYSAQLFFCGVWAVVRTRSAHMDLPISIGIVAGLGWGAVGALGGSGEIYLDSVCMLVFLLLAGRFVQLRQMRKAQGQSELLLALAPTHAERVGERGLERVRAEQLLPGDVVRVRVGQAIPVDGVVCAGQSRLDTALLTGESRPRAVAVGSEVQAGALNVQSPLEVRATVSGTNTRIAGLLHSFSSIRAERSRIRVLADRLSGLFVLAALALALLALWVGAQQGLKTGIERAVALLVVTCPCALGLATSLGSTLAMGRAARRGLLIKGGAFIEAVARPGLFVFDKTGTLSRGELTLGERRSVDAQRLAQLGCSLDALLCALERDSTHPIARAIEAQCGAAPGPMLQLDHWREEVGRGVRAVYQGHQLCLGSPQFSAPEPDAATASAIAAVRAAGQSPVLLGVDGAVACVLGFSDPLRDDTTETLHALSAQGYQLAIASGDDPDIVARVAAATGAHFRFVQGGLSPEQKHELVQQQLQAGPVYMVGDGVNDGAALAGATVGIAVHGGAEASLAVADVFATRPGLGTVALLVRGSRRTLAVIRRNFAFSLAYNLITALLAIGGYITPLLAAVLMPLSSFLIATSSFASTTFEEPA